MEGSTEDLENAEGTKTTPEKDSGSSEDLKQDLKTAISWMKIFSEAFKETLEEDKKFEGIA